MTRQRQGGGGSGGGGGGGGGGDHFHLDMGIDDYDNPDQHNTCRSTSCSSSSSKSRRGKMAADHYDDVSSSPPSPSQDTPFFFDSLTPGSLPWMIAVSGKGNRSELRPLLSDYYHKCGVRSRRPLLSERSEENGSVLLQEMVLESMLSGEGKGVLSEEDVTSGMSESSALSHHHRILSDLRESPSCRASLGSCEGRRNCPRLLWVIQRSAILSTFPGV